MQLSLHSDYALRILMALAARRERLSVDDVARQYGISRNHLAKVAQDLQTHGFIITKRGRNGGMELAKPPPDIVVGDVIRKFERLDGFVSCSPEGAGCAVDGACGLKLALSKALEAFLAQMDRYRLSDLLPNKKAFLGLLAA